MMKFCSASCNLVSICAACYVYFSLYENQSNCNREQVVNFRPGYIQPTPGLKNINKYYKYISWLYPVVSKLAPSFVMTLSHMGRAMVNAVSKGKQRRVLEVNDIKALAEEGRGK